MHDWPIQKYGMVVERMVKNEHLNELGISVVSRWWIRKGQWRSYNLLPWDGDRKTTALGDIRVMFHRDFYEGIETGTINWRIK